MNNFLCLKLQRKHPRTKFKISTKANFIILRSQRLMTCMHMNLPINKFSPKKVNSGEEKSKEPAEWTHIATK